MPQLRVVDPRSNEQAAFGEMLDMMQKLNQAGLLRGLAIAMVIRDENGGPAIVTKSHYDNWATMLGAIAALQHAVVTNDG